MGVDIGEAHWSYTAFHRFRRELAELEGFELEEMEGFLRWPGGRPWDTVHTPLAPLLDHSDCDGELSPAECEQMIPRLTELLPKLSNSHDREQARLLLEEFKASTRQQEPLEFM